MREKHLVAKLMFALIREAKEGLTPEDLAKKSFTVDEEFPITQSDETLAHEFLTTRFRRTQDWYSRPSIPMALAALQFAKERSRLD